MINWNEEIEKSLMSVGLTHLQAVRLALELVEQSGAGGLRGDKQLRRCRRVIQIGAEQTRLQERTVCFARAAAEALKMRSTRRRRTIAEFDGVCRRLMRSIPSLSRRSISSIGVKDCEKMLEAVFPTPRQRVKGRAILHAVFAHAARQGWCASNPVKSLMLPLPEEKEIVPLNTAQLHCLLCCAQKPLHRACMPALGVMLWCGVRPAEVQRLSWEDIDWEERVIVLRPGHSKTGGCRHVPMRPVLAAWLSVYGLRRAGSLCPPDWLRRWRSLRREAGLIPWQQDVLRHTFASYHAKYFHNFAALQEEMGHRSASLLRTRYLSMRGIVSAGARLFWQPGGLGR